MPIMTHRPGDECDLYLVFMTGTCTNAAYKMGGAEYYRAGSGGGGGGGWDKVSKSHDRRALFTPSLVKECDFSDQKRSDLAQ